MGFLLRSKAEGNVGPLLPSSCRLPRAALSSLALLITSNSLWEWIGGHQPRLPLVGARSLGKGCRPHATSSANASLSSAASTGWGCARLLSCPLQSLDRSQKSVLPFTSRGLCLFFFGSIISDSTVHFPGKAPPEHDCASSQGTARGCLGTFGGKQKKKKSTHPSFHPQYLSANSHQWSTPPTSFHPAKNPGKHLNSGTGGAPAALLWLSTQHPARGERFWIILSNKSPPWEPREDWKY